MEISNALHMLLTFLLWGGVFYIITRMVSNEKVEKCSICGSPEGELPHSLYMGKCHDCFIEAMGIQGAVKRPILKYIRNRDLGEYYVHGEDYDMHDKCFRCGDEFDSGDHVFTMLAKHAETDLDISVPFPYCEVCMSKQRVKEIL